MENEIHKDVFIQVQTTCFPYRYVKEKIYSKCTLDMTLQATVSSDTLEQFMHKPSQSTSSFSLWGMWRGN